MDGYEKFCGMAMMNEALVKKMQQQAMQFPPRGFDAGDALRAYMDTLQNTSPDKPEFDETLAEAVALVNFLEGPKSLSFEESCRLLLEGDG